MLSRLEQDPDLLSEPLERAIDQSAETLVQRLHEERPEMIAERRADRADYAALIDDCWAPAFEHLEMLIRLAYEVGDDFNQHYGEDAYRYDDLVFSVVVRLQARGVRIAEEILVLLKAGFGQGALARWRALHEVAVVAAFIAKHGHRVAERYVEHYDVEAYRAIEEFQTRAEQLAYEPYSDDEVNAARAARDAATDRHGAAFGRPYGWATEALRANPAVSSLRGFQAIEADVERDHLRPHYRTASHSTHANPHSIMLAPDQRDTDPGILAGPSPFGLADAGHSTCVSLVDLTATLLGTRDGYALPFVVAALLKISDQAGSAFAEAEGRADRHG
jgi:hypothetical protein